VHRRRVKARRGIVTPFKATNSKEIKEETQKANNIYINIIALAKALDKGVNINISEFGGLFSNNVISAPIYKKHFTLLER
jgi:hypothetical protein